MAGPVGACRCDGAGDDGLKFVTTVYIPAMRDPYSAAKAIGTAAYLADGRVELGIGVGWCEEEFALMGQRFDRRGKRTDEMLELFRALWQPGWTEFAGEFYPTPRLEMEPTPPRIPIYVGGLSDIALRRAARNDGWIGDLISTDRAIASVERMRELRAEKGLTMDDFDVLTPLTDAFTARALRARRSRRHHGHRHDAVDVLRRSRGVAGREDRRHEALPQGPAGSTVSDRNRPSTSAPAAARYRPGVGGRRPRARRPRPRSPGVDRQWAGAGGGQQQEREAVQDRQFAAIAADRARSCRPRPSAAASADRSRRPPSRPMR